jgi:hypothetical protein
MGAGTSTGEQRRNDTHAPTTDAEARLFRKGTGKEAMLCFMGRTARVWAYPLLATCLKPDGTPKIIKRCEPW